MGIAPQPENLLERLRHLAQYDAAPSVRRAAAYTLSKLLS
jgi:hypothetical protein